MTDTKALREIRERHEKSKSDTTRFPYWQDIKLLLEHIDKQEERLKIAKGALEEMTFYQCGACERNHKVVCEALAAMEEK